MRSLVSTFYFSKLSDAFGVTHIRACGAHPFVFRCRNGHSWHNAPIVLACMQKTEGSITLFSLYDCRKKFATDTHLHALSRGTTLQSTPIYAHDEVTDAPLFEHYASSPLYGLVSWMPHHLSAAIRKDFVSDIFPIKFQNFLTYGTSKEKLLSSASLVSSQVRIRTAIQLQLLFRLTYVLQVATQSTGSRSEVLQCPYLPAAVSLVSSLLHSLHSIRREPDKFVNVVNEANVSNLRMVPLVVCGIRQILSNIKRAADYVPPALDSGGGENAYTPYLDPYIVNEKMVSALDLLMGDYLTFNISCGVLTKQFDDTYKRLVFAPKCSVDTDICAMLRDPHPKNPYAESASNDPYTHGCGTVEGIVLQAIRDVNVLCGSQYGAYVPIELLVLPKRETHPVSSLIMPFSYILRYILMELLKNSLLATLRKQTLGKRLVASKNGQSSQRAGAPCDSASTIYCVIQYEKEGVWIRVTDAGDGMDKSTLSSLFSCIASASFKDDILFQVADDCLRGTHCGIENLQSRMEGFGLGLAFCKAFVSYIRGQLQFYSSCGIGTDAYLYIPIFVKSACENLPEIETDRFAPFHRIHRQAYDKISPSKELFELKLRNVSQTASNFSHPSWAVVTNHQS